MNIKKIKELIDLMNENDLSEIEVDEEGLRVKLSKKAHGAIERIITPVPQANSPAVPEAGTEPSVNRDAKEVKSPMVGTFYRAASPDEESYVEVGDVVNKGDVLCIVEAMKLMNEVKAEFGGRITEIPVENAEAVEFGQTLFIVEPV